MKFLLPTILAAVLASTSPTIVPDNTTKPEHFTVSFDRGAVSACTVFKSLTETIEEDGQTVPYAPRHCWFLSPNSTSYVDDWAFITKPDGTPWDSDWDIHAEVSYDDQTLKTNVLRAHR